MKLFATYIDYCDATTEMCGEEEDNMQTPSRECEEPKVGMKFTTIGEVEELYYKYAGHKGFSVRKGSTRHSKKGLRKKTYVCSKEGISRAIVPKMQNPLEKSGRLRQIRNPRTNCKALMSLKIEGDEWMISVFKDIHNHEMSTPSLKRFLKINREITNTIRKEFDT
ncbi:hypothetical protein ZOSMA_161G00390 [Zostera marina]|uniref:FAR1 domain-containing protein n=1 Tax=Zostera marina TaxID=29655 RepID=A0A0K9PWH4_ZOSMR|nr:hypothetical protein ZOSMA_161G00390 [Zostera marina]